MQSEAEFVPTPKWMYFAGWVVAVLPAGMLLMSGSMKIAGIKPPEGTPDIGWRESSMLGLAIVEIGAALLYLWPRTSFLGAILVSGYLGGAVATHVRIGDHYALPIVLGALVWLGLYMRDERFRLLVPLRRCPCDPNPPARGFLVGFGKACFTIAVLLGVVLALIQALPGEYRVSRSAVMDAPPAKVFEQVNDFRKWDAWSPWLELDPHAKSTFEGPKEGAGAVMKWAGNDQVGEGQMTILESKANEHIKIKLEFFEPMPGVADVEFLFNPEGASTKVIWSMNGKNNYIGRAMCLVMNLDKMIGSKYDEGLARMKKVVEARK